METLVKDVVNFSIGAVKIAEQKSDQLMQQTQTKVNELIDLGAKTENAKVAQVRTMVHDAAKSLTELQEKAESFVEGIIGKSEQKKETSV